MSPVHYRTEVEGLRELRSAFRKLGLGLEDFRKVNTQVAGMVEPRAVSSAPRRTGQLAASGRSSGTVTYAAVRFGGANTPYAGVIHWGMPRGARAGRRGPHNIAPNPFAVNAVHYSEPAWARVYEDFLDRCIREAGF